MNAAELISFLPAVLLAVSFLAPAQQPTPAAPASRDIRLNVVVDTKAGQPVDHLAQQDFTVLDNKQPRPITFFKIGSPAAEPVTVIILLDAVNIPYEMVAWARQGVENYLKANQGQLAHKTTIAILTDDGVQIDNNFTTNGKALSDDLEHQQINLREIRRNSQWSGDERFQICNKAFQQLVGFAATLPGRKVLLWISPGWPSISGPEVTLSSNQEQQIFAEIVALSTRLRMIDLTVYNINPIGVQESLLLSDYYETFLKGVAKPNQVAFGNLGIQIIAVQSGGLAIESNSDVAGMIQRCLADAQSWYEIGFTPLPADKPNEYHHIEIKIDRPGIAARTRDGYYANPTMFPPP